MSCPEARRRRWFRSYATAPTKRATTGIKIYSRTGIGPSSHGFTQCTRPTKDFKKRSAWPTANRQLTSCQRRPEEAQLSRPLTRPDPWCSITSPQRHVSPDVPPMFAVPAHERGGAHASGQPTRRFLSSPLHLFASKKQTRPRRRWPGSAGLCLAEARPAQAGPQQQGRRSKVAHPSHGQVLRAAVLPLPIVQLAATASRATLRAVAGAMASPPLTRRPSRGFGAYRGLGRRSNTTPQGKIRCNAVPGRRWQNFYKASWRSRNSRRTAATASNGAMLKGGGGLA